MGDLLPCPLGPGLLVLPGAQESQLLQPPGPLGPLTPLQWDEDQQLGDLKQLLSRLCGLLLEEGGHPGAPAKPVDLGPMGKTDPRPPLLPWAQLPLPLWGRGGSGPTHHDLSNHSPNAALPPRGPRSPGTGPKHSLSTEEETLAE